MSIQPLKGIRVLGEVLREAGYAPAEIDALLASGAVSTSGEISA